jgi:hypothetical protein
MNASQSSVDLYWLPLGAGGHSVRFNGLVFEAVAARIHHRTRADLYHSALEVVLPGRGRFVIEMAPVPRSPADERGVVVRRWRDGVIPDAGEAVDSPRRLTTDEARAGQLWERIAAVPTPVWGRDELGAGEMWNSNSVISWALERSGFDACSIAPPAGGRAPGWDAGVVVARRGGAGRLSAEAR